MEELDYGKTWLQWHDLYKTKGLKGIEETGVSDSAIIDILGMYCCGREIIIPVLKSNGWSLDRFVKAEIEFGLNDEGIEYVLGQFVALDKAKHIPMNPVEMRRYLDSTYSNDQVQEIGRHALDAFRNK